MGIYTFGKDGPLVQEDTFNDASALGSLGSLSLGSLGLDELCQAPQEVIITCNNKRRRVTGYLSEPIQFSARPEWEEMFGGGIASAGGGIVQMLTNLAQYGMGWSVQQPWMNRKMYKKTEPLSFQLKVTFVAENDSETDSLSARWGVWEPLLALMSFAYPRLLYENRNGSMEPMLALEPLGLVSDKTAGQMAENRNNDRNSSTGITDQDLGIIAAATNLFKAYAVPGPALRYGMDGTNEDNQGDNVSVIVGKWLTFSACYLEDVQIKVSDIMTPNGYPLSGEATMKVTLMNGNYVDGLSGEFNFGKMPDRSDEVTKFLNTASSSAKKTIKALLDLAKTTASFWTGLPGLFK